MGNAALPHSSVLIALLLSSVTVPLAAVHGATQQNTSAGETAIRARVDSLLAQMTPEEKAGQLSIFFVFGPTKGVEETLAKSQAGALLFVTDPAEANRLQKIAIERSRLKIPLLFGFDVLHGLRTIFPVPLGLAASFDPALVEQVQAVAAAEARAVGIHWTFGPMVDISRDPRWGRIVEGAGEDPYLGSAMAAAQVRGFQGSRLGTPGRIIAGPKHFAAYGAAIGGRDYDEAEVSDNELWNVYLPPFKAAIDAGAGNIMTAYMALNGIPAAADRKLVTEVLRDTWGFKGFVVSDNNAVSALRRHGVAIDNKVAAAKAVHAGVDMAMVPPGVTASPMRELPAAVAAGLVTQAEIDEAVRRVLTAKMRMGLFEKPYVDAAKAPSVLDDPGHLRLARTAAERSAVLLRNEGGLLPLNRKTVRSIAVIGPLANSARDILGPWVFSQNKPPSASILTALRKKLGKTVRIDYSEGVRMPKRLHPSPVAMMEGAVPDKQPLDETAEIARAVDLAKGSDVALLVLGEGQDMIGEIASRSSLDLPGRQQELLDAVVATGKPVIVFLMSARPLDLKDAAPAAILAIWYPGSAGGAAVTNLLFGDAVPGGKLPFSWIRNAAQSPYSYARLPSHDPMGSGKRYWNEPNEPRYAFGHGLSYTSFAYSNLKVERANYALGQPVTVTADLKNTGGRTGGEVAQLYIHQRTGNSSRPVRELKGFQRVTLRPGEVRTLRFILATENLRYWSAMTKGWAQEESVFDVWIGGSSKADLAGTFEVKAGQQSTARD